jgi:hypothetical protein
METTERIDSLNRQLADLYGIDTISGQAIWRIVWSEEQFEWRHGTYDDFTPSGLFIRQVTETRFVPKYRQWIRCKYVLERLVVIPETCLGDLPATKLSYEPMYPFETNSGMYLPPRLDAAQFVIETVLSAQGKSSLAKYKDPVSGLNTEDCIAMKEQEIATLQEELFGNETDVGDALAHGEAIIVPEEYVKKES